MQTDGDLDLETTEWHPRTTRLYRYWRSIRPACDVLLPGRQHFDPVAVPDLLPGMWLLDVERAPFRLRYRLCGTGIIATIGREVTGMWLDEAHPEAADAGFIARYRGVAERAAPSWRKGVPRLWSHRDFGTVENLILPLARDGRQIDMLCIHSVIFRTDGSVAF